MSLSKIGVEQKVQAFRMSVKNPDSDDEQPQPVRSKRALEIIRGGQVEEPPKKKPMEFKQTFSDGKDSYLERARSDLFNKQSKDRDLYFDVPELSKKFGDATEITARLGYDEGWQIYLKRGNSGLQSSIVTINFNEINEVKDFVTSSTDEIESALKEQKQIYHYASDNLPTTLTFWSHEDTFYTNTMSFRARWIHRRKEIFQLYINNPKDNSRYQDNGYFGSRICLSRPEALKLIKVLEEIKGEVDESKM